MFYTANGNPCDVPPASPVKLNRLPAWFIQQMHTITDESERVEEVCLLFRIARSTCGSTTWLDHIGSTILDGSEVFVSEPYLRPFDDLSCARHIANSLGCELVVSEQSYWFPGKTIRLVLRPKPQTDEQTLLA
jgi:hypothetical protein